MDFIHYLIISLDDSASEKVEKYMRKKHEYYEDSCSLYFISVMRDGSFLIHIICEWDNNN